MGRLLAVATLAVLLAGCIQVGVPDEPAPTVFSGGDLPDGEVPADGGATAPGPRWSSSGPASGSEPGSPGPASASPAGTVPAPAAIAGCEGPGPPRQVGDRWDYGQDYPTLTRFSVEARETRLGFDTLRLNLTMDEAFYEIEGFAEDPRYEWQWVCAGTGALVARHEVWNATMGYDIEYEEPCQVLRYPLMVGARWSTTCTYRERTQAWDWRGPLEERYDVTVVGNETLETAGGSFEVVQVRTNRTGWDWERTWTSFHDSTNCADAVVVIRSEPHYALGLDEWECQSG